MSRTAEYTIQGFIYEFNKCLIEVLDSDGTTEIRVNGIIEDIDVIKDGATEAIQCKYHEAVSNYSLSDIYKPLLLMMDEFVKNPTAKVEYILYAHFPREVIGTKTLSKTDLETILDSTNKKFEAVILRVKGNIDFDDFLKVFKFEIGKKLEELQNDIFDKLESEGFSKEDIVDLIYGNSIQKISELAILHDSSLRIIKKTELIDQLKRKKKAAISRWTREISNYKSILKKRKENLKTNLNKNSRDRYLIIKADQFPEFNEKIIQFIDDFLAKYNSKIKLHDKTPIFIIECTEAQFSDILIRIHKKGIPCEDGLVADYFDEQKFIRQPKRIIKQEWVEFKTRICRLTSSTASILNKSKCDDLFILSDSKYDDIEKLDLNEEHLDITDFNELEYLLSIKNTIE